MFNMKKDFHSTKFNYLFFFILDNDAILSLSTGAFFSLRFVVLQKGLHYKGNYRYEICSNSNKKGPDRSGISMQLEIAAQLDHSILL